MDQSAAFSSPGEESCFDQSSGGLWLVGSGHAEPVRVRTSKEYRDMLAMRDDDSLATGIKDNWTVGCGNNN